MSLARTFQYHSGAPTHRTDKAIHTRSPGPTQSKVGVKVYPGECQPEETKCLSKFGSLGYEHYILERMVGKTNLLKTLDFKC